MDFPGGSIVKNLPANAGNTKDPVPFLGSEEALEEKMATHSSILTWGIPRTEETDMLQSMGFQRFRHDLASEHACIFTYILFDCFSFI